MYAVLDISQETGSAQLVQSWHDTAQEAIDRVAALNEGWYDVDNPSPSPLRAVRSTPQGVFESLTGEPLYV